MNSTEMRFRRRIKSETRLDRIRNEVHREELKVESIKVTIQRGKIKMLQEWETKDARKVYEAKEDGKEKGEPRKTWIEEVR